MAFFGKILAKGIDVAMVMVSPEIVGAVSTGVIGVIGTDSMGAIGIHLIQITLEGGGKDTPEMKRMLKLFVGLLKEFSVDEAKSLLKVGVEKFIEAGQPGPKRSEKDAESLCRVAMHLLIGAIESDGPNEHQITRNCLAESWVHALGAIAAKDSLFAETLVAERVNEFHKFLSIADVEAGQMARKAFMLLLQVANEKGENNLSQLLSRCIIHALYSEMGNHNDVVLEILKQEAAGILTAIEAGDRLKAVRISGTGHSNLIAAGQFPNGTGKQLVRMLAEVWLRNLSQALDHSPKTVQKLIDNRAKTFHTLMERGTNVWDAEFEVLLVAIRIGETKLARSLATSFTKQLAKLVANNQEEIRLHIKKTVHATMKTLCSTTDFAEADIISSAGMELLRAASEQKTPMLAEEFSHAWVSALRLGSKEISDMLPKLIENKTVAILRAAEHGINKKEVRALAMIPVELLMEAIKQEAKAVTRLLSLSWARALADAIDNSSPNLVNILIQAPTDAFHKAATEMDKDKARPLAQAIMELLISAISQQKKELVKLLSKSWAGAMFIDRHGRSETIDIQAKLVDIAFERQDTREAVLLTLVGIVLTAEIDEDTKLMKILSETRVRSLAYVIKDDRRNKRNQTDSLMRGIKTHFDLQNLDDRRTLSKAARNILQTGRSSREFKGVIQDIEKYWVPLQ